MREREKLDYFIHNLTVTLFVNRYNNCHPPPPPSPTYICFIHHFFISSLVNERLLTLSIVDQHGD